MMKGSFDREVDTDDDMTNYVQLDGDVDPAKLEEASDPEFAGPAMAKGSFEFDVNEDMENLNNALAAADAEEEKADKKDEKKGDKKAEPKQKQSKDAKKKAAKGAAENKKANDDEKDGKKKEEDFSVPGSLPFDDLWGSDVKYSDQIANGDDDDDKELEDEDDPRDIIVNDDGFVNQWDIDSSKASQWTALQLDQDIKIGNEKASLNKFSEELVDGSADDDKDLVDINDKEDDEVDENLDLEHSDVNLLQLEDNVDRVHGRGFANPGPAWTQIMA